MFKRRWNEVWKRLDRLETRLERRDDEVAEVQKNIQEFERSLSNFALDYDNLYEKVRTNLAKLRKRAESAPEEASPADPLADARKALAARKLKGMS
jgi:chromosome segregation ATPase